MTVEHKNITNAELHEPKDISASAVDKVYVANGAASGVWKKIQAAQIDGTSVKSVNERILTLDIDDLSIATSYFLVVPWDCDIKTIASVIDQAIAGTDTKLTAKIATVSVTTGEITIAFSGSAAEDTDTVTPTAAKTITAGSTLEIACDGATSTANSRAHLAITLDIA